MNAPTTFSTEVEPPVVTLPDSVLAAGSPEAGVPDAPAGSPPEEKAPPDVPPAPPPVQSPPMGGLAQRQEALLRALEPFLRPSRREKIERALQIARLSGIAGSALRRGGPGTRDAR